LKNKQKNTTIKHPWM